MTIGTIHEHAIKALRSQLSVTQVNYHAQQMSGPHPDPRHQGRYWQHCPALMCREAYKVWFSTRYYEPPNPYARKRKVRSTS